MQQCARTGRRRAQAHAAQVVVQLLVVAHTFDHGAVMSADQVEVIPHLSPLCVNIHMHCQAVQNQDVLQAAVAPIH